MNSTYEMTLDNDSNMKENKTTFLSLTAAGSIFSCIIPAVSPPIPDRFSQILLLRTCMV